jgi:hypothetical protein
MRLMRLLFTSGSTFVAVSLAVIDAGAQTNAIPAQASAKTTLAQKSAPSADPSRVKFLLKDCSKGTGMSYHTLFAAVRGIVARGVDLRDEALAKQFLQMGVTFALKQCPRVAPLDYYVAVGLRLGDPAAFTDVQSEFGAEVDGCIQGVYKCPKDFVGARVMNLPSELATDQQLAWDSYVNQPIREDHMAKVIAETQAARARQRDAAVEQQRQEQSAKAARSAAFAKANGVVRFVTIQQLAANPFVYQNQIVAIYGEFQQMNSATQGLFSSNDKPFVVSAIPNAKFTQQRSVVMLAGRVLGNIEIKLPVLGSTLVPHLSFVGSTFCQQQGCSEYAINPR